jgi:hypothetical protein
MSAPRGSFYAILGVDPAAGAEQIERAYRHLVELYGDVALATYSLVDADEARQIRVHLREAYEVLRDPVRRLEYDARHGLITAGAGLPVVPRPTAENRLERPATAAPARPRAEPQLLPQPVTGAALRAFREQGGITLREIAESTKISLRYLEYIEADRHAALPAPVYLRGFLQEYARAVGLEPRRTAEAYLQRVSRSESLS